MKRLISIQQALKCSKGRVNSYAKFNYRSASDILESVKPLLSEQGLAICMDDSIQEVSGKLILTAEVTLYEDSSCKELISTHACAIISNHAGMSDDQATGAASSYARKYALCGMFAIDDSTNDPDSLEPEKKNNATVTSANPSVPAASASASSDKKELTKEEKIASIMKCSTREEANRLFMEYKLDVKDNDVANMISALKKKFSK